MSDALQSFHPAVRDWFVSRFEAPTPPQRDAWPAIAAGRHTLIAAPTGSGKTLAAFLAAIDTLARCAAERRLDDRTRVVYVSPLKALSNDVRINLQEPLAGIGRRLRESVSDAPEIRALVRTGDTPASERTAMTRRPPHILVTTPESLYILLTSEGGRRMLATTATVIVDEIHAVAGGKRGSHLALSLERLEALVTSEGGPAPTRIGLSATQRPIEEIARFLVGAGGVDEDGRADCSILDGGHRRRLDIGIEMPPSPLEAVMPAEVWEEIFDRLAAMVEQHRTTLIFVNTRRLAERVARHLGERLGEERVAAHHGSLSRDQRFDAENRLKAGALSALVATASLELGIDIGEIDLVCNIGSTRAIATLLQRVGRSGHRLEAVPKGRIFPLSRDELVESAALLDAIRRGELEQLVIPGQPLDVLSQQIVAEVGCREWEVQALFDTFRRAWPYRDLDRPTFDALVETAADGFATRRGRRSAYLHHDAVHGRLRGRRGARLAAITSGGAIPDNGEFRVVEQPAGLFIGTVDEDFAVESLPGDVFQLGNQSWRIRKIEQGRVLVEDARGQPPNIPFWFGEAPGRSAELSAAVSRLREEVDRRLDDSHDDCRRWLAEEVGAGAVAAEQIVEYLDVSRHALGVMPSQRMLVIERFFDENGDQHLVLHAPFGSRVNRAWGLALRKRFCRNFNFELQAAAGEDAIVLSLGPTHSFVADEVFQYLNSATVRDVLVQALLDAPMFDVRWRWNASISLALLRWTGGRRVPPRIQRMQAEDLVAVVFPDQLACLENIAGEREIPDHPLVRQTLSDCLNEAMDVGRLEQLIASIEAGERILVTRELREPSPLAHEILDAKPYAFLDDAPLEERRTQAVRTRRWIDTATAADLGRLDPAVIEEVQRQVWPDVRDADELHDAMLLAGFLTEGEGLSGRPEWLSAEPAQTAAGWKELFADLLEQRRATLLETGGGARLWIAAERIACWRQVDPSASLRPGVAPAGRGEGSATAEQALETLVRARLQIRGPVRVAELAAESGLPLSALERGLIALEVEGTAMRGHFRAGTVGEEWCERGLLARIHRGTLGRLRREIRPVSPIAFSRFLFDWQHAAAGERLKGVEGVEAVLRQLQGYPAPAAAWESEILPTRVEGYDPAWLDALCLSGRFVWGRARPPAGAGAQPIRGTPLVLLERETRDDWIGAEAAPLETLSSDAASVFGVLVQRGACFFADIVRESGLLRTRVENALGELVACGRVTADSFAGLRALLTPTALRPAIGRRSRRSVAPFGMENAGRWSALGPPPWTRSSQEPLASQERDVATATRVAQTLLNRYGVLFRRLAARERLAPPWRELLPVLRRLEARGEIRGGRFVDGFSGEQFALPGAVGALRKVRRREAGDTAVSISAADPLNTTGMLDSGTRVATQTTHRILYRDGAPIGILDGTEPRWLIPLENTALWEAHNTLLRRPRRGLRRGQV